MNFTSVTTAIAFDSTYLGFLELGNINEGAGGGVDDVEGLEDGGAIVRDGDSRELYCILTVNGVGA